MGRDEQKEEREVLDSIFPDEITDISDVEYRISITLDVPSASDHDDVDYEPPKFLLRVQYPEDYPDEPPELDILAPANAQRHVELDVQEDRSRLLASLQSTIEENMGMAMIFTLVSALRETAELLIVERRNAAQALKDVERAKIEEEENRKFHGTAVTRESFLEWRTRFKKEMAEEARRKAEEKEAEEKRKRGVKEERRLTGRELWERGLAGKFDEEDKSDGEGEEEVEGVQGLKLEP